MAVVDCVRNIGGRHTKRERRVADRSLKVIAGPLTTTPFLVSTTPWTFLIAASTSSAFCRKAFCVFTEEFDLDWFWIAL